MCEKVITAVFDNEKTAYRAICELQNNYVTRFYYIYAAVMLKNFDGVLVPVCGFDVNKGYVDTSQVSGIIGVITGVLSEGPAIYKNTVLLKDIAQAITGEKAAVLFHSIEYDNDTFDYIFQKYSVYPKRTDRSVIQDEILPISNISAKDFSVCKIDLRESGKKGNTI